MGRARLWLSCLFSPALGVAQSDLAPDVLLLARIKVHMEENLKRLPNYTCVETVERSRRRAPARKFELVDALRLEVAMIGRKELYSWYGENRFQERDLVDMVGGGAIGNGDFALHAYSVFLSSAPTYTYVGEDILDGRRTIRYDYRVPLLLSGYRIRVPPREARVPYHGAFWVDAATLDLVRLDVTADQIPSELNLREARTSIWYGRVPIGEDEFLLPRRSELVMIDLAGNESRNRIEFTQCRQFTGESHLSFGDPPPEAPPPAPQLREFELPAGVDLELRLETPVDSETSFVGDPLRAVVARAVKKEGRVVVPKGAVVTGRLTRLERLASTPAHYVVGLEFYAIEFEGGRAPFRARLEQAGAATARIPGSTMHFAYLPPERRTTLLLVEPPARRAGVALLLARASRLQLPRGFTMLWNTDLKPENTGP
ncbi:MAG: hypothetical protein RMK57_06960 [Bryobacterales bacterium]|nr:hypothetical protein [Bryobacteraceae bacterium]MDW8354254.1 hypothetical protein [Bryobacterales bacterium]